MKSQSSTVRDRLVVIGIFALTVTGCASQANQTDASQPIALPVTAAESMYTMQVSVGDGQPFPVQLDTGSSGLRIFQKAVGDDVVLSGPDLTAEFGDGTVYLGKLAKAPLTIAGQQSSQPVPIHVVQEAKCESADVADECTPAIDKIIAEDKVYGLLGIDTYPDNFDVPNPLPYLSSAFSQYTIHLANSGSQISSGAASGTPIARYQLKEVQQRQVSSAAPAVAGTKYWDSLVTGCWAFNHAKPACVDTLFDSGTTLIDADNNLPGAPSGQGDIKAGAASIQYYTNKQDPSPAWSLTAGSDGKTNGIQVQNPDPDSPAMIAGDPFFNAFDVHYDLGAGQIALLPNPDAPTGASPAK